LSGRCLDVVFVSSGLALWERRDVRQLVFVTTL
jgi:hypothetical protein